jgi:hypothetical protein
MLARTRYSRFAPRSLFNCGIRMIRAIMITVFFVGFVYSLVYRRLLAATYPS